MVTKKQPQRKRAASKATFCRSEFKGAFDEVVKAVEGLERELKRVKAKETLQLRLKEVKENLECLSHGVDPYCATHGAKCSTHGLD